MPWTRKPVKNLLQDWKSFKKKLSQLQTMEEEQDDLLIALKDEQDDREVGLSEEDETEASGLCFECLDELRRMDRPTVGQVVGNVAFCFGWRSAFLLWLPVPERGELGQLTI